MPALLSRRPLFRLFTCPTFALFAFASAPAAPANLADAVDPMIGVIGQGSTVIGPALPNASIHPSPDTLEGGHDGYHRERPIRGFSQLHVSGTGWGQYGNLLVSPQIGLAVAPDAHDSPMSDVKARAYEYEARLTRYDILTSVVPSRHSALYRFTFPTSDQAHLVLDLAHSIAIDVVPYIKGKVRDSEVTLNEKGRVWTGQSTYAGGFGGRAHTVYFHAELEPTPAAFGTWREGKIYPASTSVRATAEQERVGAYVRLDTRQDRPVLFKIGVSFRSVEQARERLHAEIPAWDYEGLRNTARETWQKALAKITVEGLTPTQRTQFYTALYHAQIMPRERTGEFARFAADAPMWDDHYAVWDTWRTLYPLHVWLNPDLVRGTIQSFVERQRVDNMVDDTFVAGNNRTWGEQGGNNVDNIIADAHAKGLRGVDWEAAFAVLRHNAEKRREGLPGRSDAEIYRGQGWIPDSVMSSSYTLEYAYNDFLAAEVARDLGHSAEAEAWGKRSRQWEKLWKPEAESDGFSGFIVPRKSDESWVEPFDLKKNGGSWNGTFYESNSWTYSYFVPHQPARLIELMGGPERAAARLEHAIESRLIDFWNEPAFLVPQIFHFAGRPDLAARTVRSITGERYSLKGYPGDDDSGAMSSYYVWGALGLFPNAGQGYYFVNSPLVERAVFDRPDAGKLTITRSGKGEHVAALTLNGKPIDRSWLRHAELEGDVTLAFTMSEEPTTWGRSAPPPSAP